MNAYLDALLLFLTIAAGVRLVARTVRRSSAVAGGSGSEVAAAQLLAGVELPADVAAGELRVRLTRSSVCIYAGRGRGIRLRAVWRWSAWRRRLVIHDRREPQWSPDWSRPIAERAWAMGPATRRAGLSAVEALPGVAVVLVAALAVMGGR
jgi:hypothetical protein